MVVNIVAPVGKTLGDVTKTGSMSSTDLTTLLGKPAQLSALLKKQGSASLRFEDAGAPWSKCAASPA